jgi:hypothetical protein
MVLTAIVAGIIGAFFGLIIACLIRTAGDAEADAQRTWAEHMLANDGDGNLVVLERGELAEVERLSALLERCRRYMHHAPLCNYVRNGVECNCGVDRLLAEMDGWVKAKVGGE